MSYIYLRESGEESSAECFSDIPAFALSRLSLSAEKSSYKDSATESSQNSQSGTTCGLSTGDRGAEKSIASAEASPAKTSRQQAKARASTESEAGCGASSPVLLARYDRDTRSWKTPQCSLFGDSDECLETFPRSGMMQKWLVMGADDVGAPHRRKRIWILAHTDAPCERREKLQGSTSPKLQVWSEDAFRALLDTEKLQYAVHSDDDRMADGIPDFVDRFRAIGNGQVPLVAATAFNFLKREFE